MTTAAVRNAPSKLALALCGGQADCGCDEPYDPDPDFLPDDFEPSPKPTSLLALALAGSENCGTGAGGFKAGNTCAGGGYGKDNGIRTSRTTLGNIKATGAKRTRDYTDGQGRKVVEHRTDDGRLFHEVTHANGRRAFHQVHGARVAVKPRKAKGPSPDDATVGDEYLGERRTKLVDVEHPETGRTAVVRQSRSDTYWSYKETTPGTNDELHFDSLSFEQATQKAREIVSRPMDAAAKKAAEPKPVPTGPRSHHAGPRDAPKAVKVGDTVTVASRGAKGYVAKLGGKHAKFGREREFLDGERGTSGMRKQVVTYSFKIDEPGEYEVGGDEFGKFRHTFTVV